MPYINQVHPDMREQHLPKVRERLWTTRWKLDYAMYDLRWRHLGLSDESVYIFDLGSVESRDA